MARRYSPDTAEAIWHLLCEGVPAGEILRRLNSGEAGVPAPDPPMPRRTLTDKIAALKRDRGLPALRVPAGRELAAAEQIQRRLLEALARQEARLTAASKSRPLTPRETDALAKAAKVAAELRRHYAPSPQPEPAPVTSEPPRSPLAELAQRLGG